jgi:hypothetical protein
MEPRMSTSASGFQPPAARSNSGTFHRVARWAQTFWRAGRALLIFGLVMLGFQGAARAQIALAATASAVGDQTQSYGVAFNTTTGTPNYLVVGVSGTGQRAAVTITVSSITFRTGTTVCAGTVKETLVSLGNIQQGTTGARADIWATALVAGDLVSGNVCVTLGGNASDETLMGAVSLSGVGTIGAFQSLSGTTGTTTGTLTFSSPPTGSMIIDTLGRSAGTTNPTVASGQTSQWNISTGTTAGTDALGAGSTLATSTGTSVSWTLHLSTSPTWAYGAVLATPPATRHKGRVIIGFNRADEMKRVLQASCSSACSPLATRPALSFASVQW